MKIKLRESFSVRFLFQMFALPPFTLYYLNILPKNKKRVFKSEQERVDTDNTQEKEGSLPLK